MIITTLETVNLAQLLMAAPQFEFELEPYDQWIIRALPMFEKKFGKTDDALAYAEWYYVKKFEQAMNNIQPKGLEGPLLDPKEELENPFIVGIQVGNEPMTPAVYTKEPAILSAEQPGTSSGSKPQAPAQVATKPPVKGSVAATHAAKVVERSKAAQLSGKLVPKAAAIAASSSAVGAANKAVQAIVAEPKAAPKPKEPAVSDSPAKKQPQEPKHPPPTGSYKRLKTEHESAATQSVVKPKVRLEDDAQWKSSGWDDNDDKSWGKWSSPDDSSDKAHDAGKSSSSASSTSAWDHVPGDQKWKVYRALEWTHSEKNKTGWMNKAVPIIHHLMNGEPEVAAAIAEQHSQHHSMSQLLIVYKNFLK